MALQVEWKALPAQIEEPKPALEKQLELELGQQWDPKQELFEAQPAGRT